MAMDDRKMRILQAIIDDYILTGIPVGSRTISKKYDMGLSSATIRNEMSDLEELGFLDQPHVSAGRIPSAKAYRLYVDTLLETGKIPNTAEESVRSHFAGRVHQMEDVIDHAAQVISSLTHYTSVVLSPKGEQPRIQTIQLVPVSAETALLVLVIARRRAAQYLAVVTHGRSLNRNPSSTRFSRFSASPPCRDRAARRFRRSPRRACAGPFRASASKCRCSRAT